MSKTVELKLDAEQNKELQARGGQAWVQELVERTLAEPPTAAEQEAAAQAEAAAAEEEAAEE